VLRFIVRRLAYLVAVLLGVLIDLTPGDPAGAIAGPNGTAEQITLIRDQMNLDQPLLTPYSEWLGSVVHLNFGDSYATSQS
jgi:peptide/nickel transport system permease protein